MRKLLTLVSAVCWIFVVAFYPATPAWSANKPSSRMNPKERAFFENKIRPVLVKKCYSCHSSKSEELGGKLRMDSRDGMRVGGESGPAFVEGRPNESLLIQALRYDGLEMPPDEPLSEAVIQDFIQWVKMGVPDPRIDHPLIAKKPDVESAAANPELWSFQSITNPAPPAVNQPNWCFDPLDRFVLARIEQAKLKPAHDASPVHLVRRLYFDLIGLPPTAEQVEAFLNDYEQHQQQAVIRLVDELLASPHFGERWGRHWLDVARYGESNGNDGLGRNPTFPHAWRYRDYVVQALNDDVPYDRFLTEQIAGDLLTAKTPAERDRLLIATGFLAIGAKPAKAMNVNFDMDVVNDQINVIGTGVMGLSVACARCHDHKHDPIPTSDYYALAGIFLSTETMWGYAANQPLTAPETPLHVLKAKGHYVAPPDSGAKPNVDERTLSRKKKPQKVYPAGTPLAMGVREKKKIVDCKVNIKGESKKLGPKVPRGFLSACQMEQTPELTDKSSGRLQLAQWLTSADHPQTSRVMVNRIWLHLFGQALVRTPDDFGVYGERPTHPQLLDHLAIRFRTEGWSIKQLIREIVLSHTYQLSSFCDEQILDTDPENRLLCRHNRRRLDAESLRDSILAVSGQLNREPGLGSAIANVDELVNKAGNLHLPHNHRSIYLCMLRHSEPPELSAFDLPDSTKPVGKRNETTLPTQSLFLLNSPFLVEQADSFAKDVLADPELNDTDRVHLVYRRALNRSPESSELQRALKLLEDVDQALESEISQADLRRVAVWATLCQALLNTNEFRYVD
ncbi:PSD1 and planctomycete cytochrome C domain-containing protein [Gimesia panareensis]|uniref:Planctomycete cytochrome C n=1 Tax=Gimesia panareensis TaxID=2527978 RepID=A0A517QDS6_9PLAN|nr:PSD1 and planctomycete cytochrome C domain-containing protein [Gimesia panareensis]QDT29780.1 Planctomycete cytochrome C [Gimesia panareensis]QDU52827.1 Planctomycete cytochrome C [Gimesia panareensis]